MFPHYPAHLIAGVAAFAANAVLYVPLMIVLLLWKRPVETPRLPPERLGRAIISGVRRKVRLPSASWPLGTR